MGFNTPDQSTMEQARDQAEAAHNDYWSQNGYPTRSGLFFPGFETGWHDACAALSSGNSLPDDVEGWAKQRAGEKNQSGDAVWEWEHGFKQGVSAAQKAGTTE